MLHVCLLIPLMAFIVKVCSVLESLRRQGQSRMRRRAEVFLQMKVRFQS